MSVFFSEKQVTRQSAHILMFDLSVDQTIIKSVDAAVDRSCTWPGLAVIIIDSIFGFSQTFRDVSTRLDN